MKISQFLSLEEATKSQTALKLGINNAPTVEQLENMKCVANEIFDPVRKYVGGPLFASSFFRSKQLNDAIPGSSKTSQHMKGEAIDIDCDTFNYGTNVDVFHFIREQLDFDQLIGEYPNVDGDFAWVHVSKTLGKNRGEVLVKLRSKYIPFSQYKVGMV
jgi:zinc D-Ala-D-Ala carboxypeptidase